MRINTWVCSLVTVIGTTVMQFVWHQNANIMSDLYTYAKSHGNNKVRHTKYNKYAKETIPGGITAEAKQETDTVPVRIDSETGRAYVKNYDAELAEKADVDHTHNYAGSSSAGGSANSAVKLDTSAGSATQPVYFSGGKPVACTYTLAKSVPSNAVFTDTQYDVASGQTDGLMSASDKRKLDTVQQNANYYIKYDNAILDKNFKNILQCSDIKKDCFNYKAIGYILKKNNINLNGINCDLLLCSYLLNSNNSSDVKTTFLFFDKTDIDPKIDQFNSSLKISIYSRLLSNKILDDLKNKDDFNLYENIELPLSKCLLNMEYEGFPLNKQTLLSVAKNYQDKLDILTHDIYRLAGCEFNIDSPKQVSNLLFNVLQLKSNRKSSTSIDYLKYLIDEHPIVEKILSYRKYAKLLNTYVNGLLNYIGKDNKIHCIFNQAQTTTGRLSSSEPNMQNIAVRDEESKEIRKAFFYDNDLYCILSYDYSQIELRILASLSKCKNLINAFNSNIDIHTLTAQKIFNKTQITEQERRKAKAVNFGIVYGISDYGLKEQINVPLKEAKEIINKFYETYPEIKTYMQNQIEFATKNGYVKTIFNRKRFIEEINSPNYSKREFAKRAACNAPIQGSAADIIKIIMTKIDKLLENYDSKLVLQIHDELIFKINKNELKELETKIKDIMENTIKLDVKLTVDGGYAKDWYSVK